MAGIYITGIQMPVGEEMLCLNIHPDGKVTQHFELRCDGIGRAFPVPDHGRLIDADALCRLCDNTIDHSVTPNDIMRVPTIIPADGKDGAE